MNEPRVLFAQIVGNRKTYVDGAILNISTAKKFGLDCLVAVDYSMQRTWLNRLYESSVELVMHDNNPITLRNECLLYAKRHNYDYLFIIDTDEHPDESLLTDLYSILTQNEHINCFRVLSKVSITNPELLDAGELSPYGDKFWKTVIIKVESWMQEPGIIEPITQTTPLTMTYQNWHILNLPEKYFYIHEKKAEDIWYGATRDLFLGAYLEEDEEFNSFRKICSNYSDLTSFLYSLKADPVTKFDEDTVEFIIAHRSSKYAMFRSLFKYYKSLHPEIEEISKYTPYKSTSTEEIVTKAYLEILGRHPDKRGLEYYSKLVETAGPSSAFINDSIIKNTLRRSEEYMEKNLNTAFFDSFGRVPSALEFETYSGLYSYGVITDFDVLFKRLRASYIAMPQRIAYCQMCHAGDFEQALSNMTKVKDYVDEVIVVYDQTLSEKQISLLGKYGYYKRWQDNFPLQRNYYVNLAKQKSCGWMLVSDPDEEPSEQLLSHLREIVNNANQQGSISSIGIKPHDLYTDTEDGVPLDTPSVSIPEDYWKVLLLKVTPELRYVGVGEMQNVHEDIVNTGIRANLPPEYYYEHKKSHKHDIWPHAVRNLWIGGSSNNIGKNNPHWVSLRNITDELGFKTWYEFNEYLKKGNVSEKLKDWMWQNRNAVCHDYDSESREVWKYYFITLHPDEVPVHPFTNIEPHFDEKYK